MSGGFKPRSDTHGPSIRTSPDPAHHAEFGLRERRRSRPGPAWGCHSLTGFEDLLVRLTMLSAVRVRKCVRGPKLTHRFLHVTMAAGTVTLAIIGRDKELDSISAFVDRSTEGAAALVLEGEAGIGKSTLWQAGVDAARAQGLHVLVSRPAEAESRWTSPAWQA